MFACKTEVEKTPPNILFIAIDDLRPELGCYGSPVAISPNIDAIANDGMRFNRAYCQQPICGPSRASLMSGARPETTNIIHNYVKLRSGNDPNVITLPQHLRANGYETLYVGKIFHGADTDEELSWSRQPVKVKGLKKPVLFAKKENREQQKATFKEMEKKYGEQARYGLASGPAYECDADVPDETYRDGYNTEIALATIKELANDSIDKPFFLGVGYYKPHLNWIAPKKYWDMYEGKDIPLALNDKAPEGYATMGLHPSFELRVRDGVAKIGDIAPDDQVNLKRAYLSCVSYVDAQVGKLINALDENGLRENTIIVVWGDHGWHLGDMGIWGKATNYEIATRVPMMIWTPDMPAGSRGKSSDALVELVDIYPTLCDLAGIEQPSHLDGKSYTPLLDNPEQTWKDAVFSQFPCPALREWGSISLRPGMRDTYFKPLIQEMEHRIEEQQGDLWDKKLYEDDVVGYAMRTDRYRLIVWKDRSQPERDPLYIELYDHQLDSLETKNIANEQPDVTRELMVRFNAADEIRITNPDNMLDKHDM